MQPFELTTRNVEHADATLSQLEGTAKPKGRQTVADMQALASAKLAAFTAEIAEVRPDNLFRLCGPGRRGSGPSLFRPLGTSRLSVPSGVSISLALVPLASPRRSTERS